MKKGTKISFDVNACVDGRSVSFGGVTSVEEIQKLWKVLKNGESHSTRNDHGIPEFGLHFSVREGKIRCRGFKLEKK